MDLSTKLKITAVLATVLMAVLGPSRSPSEEAAVVVASRAQDGLRLSDVL